MSQSTRSHRRASLAAIATLMALPALPTLASPPSNPGVGQTYVESTPVRTTTRNFTRMNPSTGALEQVQETYQEYRDQTKVYQQTGSHPEVRPTTHPVWQQIGSHTEVRPTTRPDWQQVGSHPEARPTTRPEWQQVGSHPEVRPTTRPEWQQTGTQRVAFTNQRWVEPPPPTKVYAYGRADVSFQWDLWNAGIQSTQNLMGNKFSRNQDMSVGAKWTIYSLVMREGNDRWFPPGRVYLYTEDGTIIGECHYTQVQVGASYSGGHYWTGGNNIDINGQSYDLLGVALSSPIVLDLDHDGKIGVTGQASGFTRVSVQGVA